MSSSRGRGAELVLSGLTKRFPDSIAVDNVSLAIAPSEFLTLLGPSGSGKTTTLNMIAGFTEPSDGAIMLDGRPIAALPAHKRNIGVVFQDYALFPHMTAEDNIAFGLRQRKMKSHDIRRQVNETLGLVQLGNLGRRYPRELSGGQQQRVALARAIVFRPPLLLMDEPLGSLDKKLREELQVEIKTIQREVNATCVYVTHDQEEALALSDRIAVMNEGRIQQIGDGRSLYENPANLFVAGFLGESNLFVGRIRREGDVIHVEGDGYKLLAPGSGSLPAVEVGVILVRPERLRVMRTGPLPPGHHNAVVGFVRQVMYLGATSRVEIDLPRGQRLTARAPTSDLPDVASGDEVRVSWSPADSVLLADPRGTGASSADERPLHEDPASRFSAPFHLGSPASKGRNSG